MEVPTRKPRTASEAPSIRPVVPGLIVRSVKLILPLPRLHSSSVCISGGTRWRSTLLSLSSPVCCLKAVICSGCLWHRDRPSTAGKLPKPRDALEGGILFLFLFSNELNLAVRTTEEIFLHPSS